MFFSRICFKRDLPDIRAWKALNHKVAYTISGCNSGVAQSTVAAWSYAGGNFSVCDKCIWQDKPEVCVDAKNLAWGKKVATHCDIIFTETSPALDYVQAGKKIVRDPASMCLDSEFWKPDLIIPPEHRVVKEEGELLIYHSMGNYHSRASDTKNIKGTPFIFEAVERLQKEGHKLKLLFITDKPNTVVRFYQAQADIIVDQLNYGRYGATAREGMMLGRPVICYLNKFEYDQEDALVCLEECPLVSASELTVYEALKRLVLDSALREKLGKRGRQYALKWHCAKACAVRYEQLYDALFF